MNTSHHPWERFPPDIVIPSDANEAQRVQDHLAGLLQACQFGERDIFAIKLAVEEALVNAIKHGNQFDRTKCVRVAYHIEADTFHIRIRDEGKGFKPEEVPDPTMDENLERPCGRGLLLMRHYMCAVEYRENGTMVLMSKRRNGTANPGSTSNLLLGPIQQ